MSRLVNREDALVDQMKESLVLPPNKSWEGLMIYRYTVYDRAVCFASVHAVTPEEAIMVVCKKTDGHDLRCCSAVPAVFGAVVSELRGVYPPLQKAARNSIPSVLPDTGESVTDTE